MKRWSIFLYMAGDNDLSGAALEDLQELALIGSNDSINIVAQVDQPGQTSRYLVPADATNSFLQKPYEVLPSVNTGDPKSLSEFVEFGLTNFPAEKTMLVLWNHGSGWRPFPTARWPNPPRKLTLFNHSFSFGSRWIGFDQTSDDALDMAELRLALAKVFLNNKLTRSKFDIIAFDACLMSSLEVAFQVSDFTDWIVASPYKEPTDGWPYDQAFASLKNNPLTNPSEFLKAAVDAYSDSYQSGASKPDEIVSISILNMVNLASSAAEISHFADLLKKRLISNRLLYKGIIASARDGVRNFRDREYVDISDFAQRIDTAMKTYGIDDSELAQACAILRSYLNSMDSFVTYRYTWEEGPYPAPQNIGFSIFYPAAKQDPDTPVMEAYKNLEITKKYSSWWSFIETYFST